MEGSTARSTRSHQNLLDPSVEGSVEIAGADEDAGMKFGNIKAPVAWQNGGEEPVRQQRIRI